MVLAGLPAPAAAQLAPSGDNPLPLQTNGHYVPVPLRSGYVRVTLPKWLVRHEVVRVRHGTEIFRVANYRVTWKEAGRKRAVTVPAAVGVERSTKSMSVEAISGLYDFPLDADVMPVAKQYTLVFYAPGQQRSPLLRYVSPDYVIP